MEEIPVGIGVNFIFLCFFYFIHSDSKVFLLFHHSWLDFFFFFLVSISSGIKRISFDIWWLILKKPDSRVLDLFHIKKLMKFTMIRFINYFGKESLHRQKWSWIFLTRLTNIYKSELFLIITVSAIKKLQYSHKKKKLQY